MIFKKHLSILLTVLLLVSNLGLAINVHYCADEIASITINAAPASAKVVDECCGIVEEEQGCCNDKIIKAEIKSDKIIVESLSFDTALHSVIYRWKSIVFISKNHSKQKDKSTYYCDANAPPFYILYSQYTFYA
jgi:hypothetical protein